MEALLYFIAYGLIWLLQTLPLRAVAWLGRRGGALAYSLDARHRRVALDNLTLAFGAEKEAAQIRALARENFRRLGENYASAVKIASMSPEGLAKHVQFIGVKKILPHSELEPPVSRVLALGHFGNFELCAWAGRFLSGWRAATTYRALPQRHWNRLVLSLRQKSGCLLFERRVDGPRLRKAMQGSNLMVGLLCDQHAGRAGLWIPFFGCPCSTSAAPAVLAQRYGLPLHTAVCFRIGLGRWRIEIGDQIPTHRAGKRRASLEIMTEVNQAFELAIRRDPANWFWVHRRWKPAPPNRRMGTDLNHGTLPRV